MLALFLSRWCLNLDTLDKSSCESTVTGSEHGVIGGDGELGEEVVGIGRLLLADDVEGGAGEGAGGVDLGEVHAAIGVSVTAQGENATLRSSINRFKIEHLHCPRHQHRGCQMMSRRSSWCKGSGWIGRHWYHRSSR